MPTSLCVRHLRIHRLPPHASSQQNERLHVLISSDNESTLSSYAVLFQTGLFQANEIFEGWYEVWELNKLLKQSSENL